MKELVKKLKQLTGYKMTDIAIQVGVTRQFIDSSFNNYSKTYINSNKFMLLTMVDKYIDELELKINELKEFKKEIKEKEYKECK